jgi:hypothetical protein
MDDNKVMGPYLATHFRDRGKYFFSAYAKADATNLLKH